MKKILGFLTILIVLFVALAIITNSQNDNQAEFDSNKNSDNKEDTVSDEDNQKNNTDTILPNPYHKEALHPETIKQLDDPNYQDIILPETLDRIIANGKDVTVYFYSPLCSHCLKTTPILTELANELDSKIYQFNLLEFEDGWDKYDVVKTPTLIQYNDGKEAKRLIGTQEKEAVMHWLLNE